MAEQWQSIPNYERYLVSDQGRVMNSATNGANARDFNLDVAARSA
jgi:hypothetical protein